MANLGITVDMVLESINAPYLSTFPTDAEGQSQKDNFLNELKDSASSSIQAKIDEASGLIDSVVSGASAAITSSATFAVSAVTADPMAPLASTGVIASTKGAVGMAKSSLITLQAQLSQATNILNNFLLPLPPVVDSTNSLLQQATNALNALPV